MKNHCRIRIRSAAARERGAAIIVAILVTFVLTVLGLALLFTTSTEFQIAGAETTVNKTFYAADSGTQYGNFQIKALRFTPDTYQLRPRQLRASRAARSTAARPS
jgi:Tfp pilus assembly protein PilX